MANNPIQLDNTVAGRAKVSIDPEEHPDERAARLIKEERDHRYETRKKYALLSVIIVAALAVGLISAYEALLDPTASAETKRWAQTVLSALVAGAISFMVGQAAARPR